MVENRYFSYSPAFDVPVKRGSPSKDCHKVWHGKTTWVYQVVKKKFDDMFGRFDTMLAYDGRTDGQTSCDNVVCAMHTRRTVKIRLISIKNIKAIKMFSLH